MKKHVSAFLLTAMLGLTLCGCGSYRTDSNGYRNDDMVPEMNPIITPDVKDGVVDDRDGIIDSQDSREATNGIMPSTSPTVQQDRP